MNTIRVLHIVENFHGQAVESWLFRVLEQVKRRHPHLAFSFFCLVAKPSPVDEIIRQLGGEVIHPTHHFGQPYFSFIAELRRVMWRGRFDVLHCHHDILSGLPLLASWGLPIRRRIVHVHNTQLSLPTHSRLKQAIMRLLFRQTCLRADRIVGVSQEALAAMLGKVEPNLQRDGVIHCGIATERFLRDEAKAFSTRRSFGFGLETKILLFVGRMTAYKNPTYVVEMLTHLRGRGDDFAAVFAGAGPYEEQVSQLAVAAGLQNCVRVLGWRDDIPELMQACDLLIWPGLEEPKEGLGLGVVEAQAAGLPVLMSRNVPAEAIVVPELVKILPLTAGPKVWAENATEMLRRPLPARNESQMRVAASSFSIAQSADNLAALYGQP